LLGIQYVGDNETNFFPLRVYADKASDPLIRNTGLEQIPAGAYVDIGKNLVGWEWDGFVDNGDAPHDVTVLFDSPVFGEILQDAGGSFLLGKARAETTYYQAPSGSFVFNSGTIQWSFGLDLYEPDLRIQQITYNVFERMSVLPATPGPDLVVDGMKNTPRSSNITLVPQYATNPPKIRDIVVDDSQQTTITIQWQTDNPSTSQVWYWKENSKGYFSNQSVWVVPSTLSATDLVQAHQLILMNLTPENKYYFEVVSQDEEGNTALSSPQTFLVPQVSAIQRFVNELQPIKSGIICGAKPFILPGFYWLTQLNGWIVSGLVSISFLFLGIRFINRRHSI
jgi:hypothetical protein